MASQNLACLIMVVMHSGQDAPFEHIHVVSRSRKLAVIRFGLKGTGHSKDIIRTQRSQVTSHSGPSGGLHNEIHLKVSSAGKAFAFSYWAISTERVGVALLMNSVIEQHMW